MFNDIREVALAFGACFTGLGIIYLYIANLRSTIKTLEVHLELANNAIHIKNSTLESTEMQLDKNKERLKELVQEVRTIKDDKLFALNIK